MTRVKSRSLNSREDRPSAGHGRRPWSAQLGGNGDEGPCATSCGRHCRRLLGRPAACPTDVRPAGPHRLPCPDPAGSPTGQSRPKAAAPRPRHRAPRCPPRPRLPQAPGFQTPKPRKRSQASSKLQHFIAASAKVRFLKLVKFGQHFHVKWYNFTSLVSYLILHAETETW